MLPLDELVRRIEGAEPGRKVAFVWVEMDSDKAGRIFYTAAGTAPRRVALDRSLHRGFRRRAARRGFFNLMMQLHRFLAMGEYGKVTAACTLILIFFCLSGLYLRWPRKVLDWRAWLTLDWSRKAAVSTGTCMPWPAPGAWRSTCWLR